MDPCTKNFHENNLSLQHTAYWLHAVFEGSDLNKKVFTIRIPGPQHQAVSNLPKCSHLDIGQQVIKGTRVDNYGTWVC